MESLLLFGERACCRVLTTSHPYIPGWVLSWSSRVRLTLHLPQQAKRRYHLQRAARALLFFFYFFYFYLPYFSQWQDTKGGWFHLEEALLSFMWSKEVHPKIFISEFFFPRKGGLCKIPVVNTNSCNEETQGSVQFCTYSTPLSSRAKVLGDQRS